MFRMRGGRAQEWEKMRPASDRGVERTVRRWWMRGAVAICVPFLLFLAEAQVIMTDPPGDSGRIAGALIPRWQIRIQEKGSRQDEK